jgi:excisionase family DNA binding protein
MEKLLTIREVALVLGIGEKEVIELAEKGIIPAYKVAGVYLRFKKEQVEGLKDKLKDKLVAFGYNLENKNNYTFWERVNDFFYFNDFYILSFLILLLMLVFILRG